MKPLTLVLLSTVLLSIGLALPAVAAPKGKAPAAPAKEPAKDVLDDDTATKAAASEEAAPAADEKPAESAPSAAGSSAAGSAAPVATTPVEETIFVVQGKPYLAKGRFELAPQVMQSVNDSFTSHTGLMVSGLYHLKENVAFEVAAGAFGWWDVAGPRFGGRDSELTVELREKESLAPERVKLYQFPWLVGADAQWSPFYGKVSVQDLALGQFNLYLSVGASVLGLALESLTQPAQTVSYVTLPTTFGALPTMALSTTFGGGLRFYFTDWLGVRIEVRDYVIPLAIHEGDFDDAEGPSFDVTNLVLAQAGVSFSF